MAIETAEITYASLCDKPSCLCVDTQVLIFLQDGVETTDDKRFILGMVTEVQENTDNSVTVTVQFDDSTLPDGFTLTFPVAGVGGTACAPDCLGPCAWMTKLLAIAGTDVEPVVTNPIVLDYQLLPISNDGIENGTYPLPRMGIPEGLKLRALIVTSDIYNAMTSYNFTFYVGAVPYVATTSITASGAFVATLASANIAFDAAMSVVIGGVSQTYPTLAEGIVVTLVGDLL